MREIKTVEHGLIRKIGLGRRDEWGATINADHEYQTNRKLDNKLDSN